jgi:hypothetical protein
MALSKTAGLTRSSALTSPGLLLFRQLGSVRTILKMEFAPGTHCLGVEAMAMKRQGVADITTDGT